MRGFLIVTGVVLGVIALGVAFVTPFNYGNGGVLATAAQSNLVMALRGSNLYHIGNNQSYVGLVPPPNGPEAPDPLLITTGLSTGPDTVSVSVGFGGTYVVMIAATSGAGPCWGILVNRATVSGEILGISGAAGTYFFVAMSGGSAGCEASNVTVAKFSDVSFQRL